MGKVLQSDLLADRGCGFSLKWGGQFLALRPLTPYEISVKVLI